MKVKQFVLVMFFLLLTSCMESAEPMIVVGREWNQAVERVADTSSIFALNDPIVFQLQYGKNFDFDEIEYIVYEGTIENRGPEKWRREAKVSSRLGSYAVKGKSSAGGLMTARELFRVRKAGFITLEFKSQDSVIAVKEIEVVKE